MTNLQLFALLKIIFNKPGHDIVITQVNNCLYPRTLFPCSSGNPLFHSARDKWKLIGPCIKPKALLQLQHSFQGKSFITRLQMQVDSYYLSFITGFPVWTGQQAVVFQPSFKSIWIWRSVNTPPKIFDFLRPGKFYQPGTNVFDCVTWNKA